MRQGDAELMKLWEELLGRCEVRCGLLVRAMKWFHSAVAACRRERCLALWCNSFILRTAKPGGQTLVVALIVGAGLDCSVWSPRHPLWSGRNELTMAFLTREAKSDPQAASNLLNYSLAI